MPSNFTTQHNYTFHVTYPARFGRTIFVCISSGYHAWAWQLFYPTVDGSEIRQVIWMHKECYVITSKNYITDPGWWEKHNNPPTLLLVDPWEMLLAKKKGHSGCSVPVARTLWDLTKVDPPNGIFRNGTSIMDKNPWGGRIFPTELTVDWQLEYHQKKFVEIDYGLNLN